MTIRNRQLNKKPFEPIYNEYLAYNDLGREVSRQIDLALKPLYDRLYHEGVNPRQLTGMICSAALCKEAEMAIMHGITLRKQKQAAKEGLKECATMGCGSPADDAAGIFCTSCADDVREHSRIIDTKEGA